MKTPAPILLGLALALAGSVRAAVPPVRIDADGPAEDPVTLDLEELWRAGGEDGDVIFGRINDVVRHPDGELHVLDNQLCQVEVFDAEGRHLRTLSRQGDGPGEVRQPIGVVLLPGDLVGVGAGFPGKLVALRRDGTPAGTRYPIGEPAEGNVGVMISVDTGGGVLAATGGRIVFDGPDDSHTERFLAVGDADGGAYTRILARTTPIDPTGRRWDEAADYYFDGSWDLGPDGRIYVPLDRDAYEVTVCDRTGARLLVFGRDVAPRRRTAEEKREVGPVISVNGQRNDEEWDICDHDPAVSRIMVDPDEGNVWVLTPHGANDQPDGVLQTWDVFDPQGAYLRQVAVPRGEGIVDGTVDLVGDGLLVLVRGTGSPLSGRAGADDEEADVDAEVEPLEVICYRIR